MVLEIARNKAIAHYLICYYATHFIHSPLSTIEGKETQKTNKPSTRGKQTPHLQWNNKNLHNRCESYLEVACDGRGGNGSLILPRYKAQNAANDETQPPFHSSQPVTSGNILHPPSPLSHILYPRSGHWP